MALFSMTKIKSIKQHTLSVFKLLSLGLVQKWTKVVVLMTTIYERREYAGRSNCFYWVVLVVPFPLLSSLQLSCTWQLEALVRLVLSIVHWHCLRSPAFVLYQAVTRQWTHKATRRRYANILIHFILEQEYNINISDKDQEEVFT